MDKKKMIIFDLDGTLWDSSQAVADSWNLVFRDYASEKAPGVSFPELTDQDLKNVMGKTMDEIARIIMPDMEPELRSVIFKKCETFEVSYLEKHGGTLFPEVESVLNQLLDKGFSLAIVSNCQIDYVKAFLTSMHMESFFCDYEEWGRTGLTKAENIRLVMSRQGCTDAVYVGDTQKDKDAADGAGVPFIWASYGFGDVKEYMMKLNSFSDLRKLPFHTENVLP